MKNMMDASRESIAELHDARLSAMPQLTEALFARYTPTGHPRPGLTLSDLRDVADWFFVELLSSNLPATSGVPLWWRDDAATADQAESNPVSHGRFTLSQMALIDEMQSYLSAVLVENIPTAEWQPLTGHKLDPANGRTVLKIANRQFVDAMTVIYSLSFQRLAGATNCTERLIKHVEHKIALSR